MLKLACIGLLFVVFTFISCDNSTAEKNAGEAIGKLLQEKIGKKFRDAANEVKGVLVKHLGKSLKEAHSKMNPKPKPKKIREANVTDPKVRERKSNPKLPLSKKPSDEECRLKKMAHPAKCHACESHKLIVKIQGASIHHNKSGRNRKDGNQMTLNGEGQRNQGQNGQNGQNGQGGFGIQGPGGPGVPGPPGSSLMQPPQGQPGSPLMAPGAPQPAQCGGSCPSSCAPTCDNTCCAMQQACPPACVVSCFSYCPSQCCRK